MAILVKGKRPLILWFRQLGIMLCSSSNSGVLHMDSTHLEQTTSLSSIVSSLPLEFRALPFACFRLFSPHPLTFFGRCWYSLMPRYCYFAACTTHLLTCFSYLHCQIRNLLKLKNYGANQHKKNCGCLHSEIHYFFVNETVILSQGKVRQEIVEWIISKRAVIYAS